MFGLYFCLCQHPHAHVYFLEPFNFQIKQIFYRLHALVIATSSSRNCVTRWEWGQKMAPRGHGTTEEMHSTVTFKWLSYSALPAFVWHLYFDIWMQRFNLRYSHFLTFWLKSSVISHTVSSKQTRHMLYNLYHNLKQQQQTDQHMTRNGAITTVLETFLASFSSKKVTHLYIYSLAILYVDNKKSLSPRVRQFNASIFTANYQQCSFFFFFF